MAELFSGLFTPDPGVVDGILAISVIYVLAIWPLRRYLAPEQPLEKWRVGLFFTGVLVLILAVATPIDEIGETYLFSVHMFQHVLLIFAVPPLFLLGLPNWLVDFLLRTEGLGAILRFLIKPVVSCVLFNFTLLFWHIPAFYDLALRDSSIHLLEHVSFVVTSILMFWPLIDPGTKSKRQGNHPGIKILFILGVSIGQLPLFAALTFSTRVFYPTYEKAPRLESFNISPLDDQILGGAIMKISAIIYMVVGLIVYLYRWYREEG